MTGKEERVVNRAAIERLTQSAERRRVVRAVSFPPEHVAAIEEIAAEESHGNFSRIVQDLIEREMRARHGRDWRSRVVDAGQRDTVPA